MSNPSQVIRSRFEIDQDGQTSVGFRAFERRNRLDDFVCDHGCAGVVRDIDVESCIDLSGKFRAFPIRCPQPATRKAPVWIKRSGDIPQPSGGYAWRAGRPCTAPSRT